jgi:type I restriction enzyme M protein
MINGELKKQVDKLWTEFWTGGITNPHTPQTPPVDPTR